MMQMAMIQVGTLMTSLLFFNRLFSEERERESVLWGVFFYLLCPYRLYVCYGAGDVPQALAGMLLPLSAWTVLGIIKRKNRVLNLLAVPLFLGLFWYLLLEVHAEPGMLYTSIMGNGYEVGWLFTSFPWGTDHPGVGIGLMLALSVGAWLVFVKGIHDEEKRCRIFTLIAAALLLLSLKYCPWELAQRVCPWTNRAVALLKTPAVFAGAANFCLCVPGAWAMGQWRKLLWQRERDR